MKKRRVKKMPIIILLVIIIGCVVGVMYLMNNKGQSNNKKSGKSVKTAEKVKKDETRKMEYNDNNKKDSGNYNAVRTGATDVSRSGIDKDTMTTWMWITLIAATTIIIAAIWYYVTQTND